MLACYLPTHFAKAGIYRSSSRFSQAASGWLQFLGSLSPPMPSRGESGSPLFGTISGCVDRGGNIVEMVFENSVILHLNSSMLRPAWVGRNLLI